MANGATTPTRLGDINAGGGDVYELFLKVFSGEILTTFDRTNVMMPRHRVRQIASGKSAQFPAIGTASASYHVPGDDLLDAGNSYVTEFLLAERVISIDNLLVSSCFIPRIDEVMNHYDVRQPFAHKLGRALADSADTMLLRVACLAARATTTVTNGFGGQEITDADFVTNPMSTVDTCFEIAQKLDEQNIPSEDRFLAVKPAVYYGLIKAAASRGQLESVEAALDDVVLRTSYPGLMGQVDVGMGRVYKIAGLEIVKTNHVPSTDISSPVTGANNTYDGDFTNTVGVAWQKEAIGTVKLLDLATESQYLVTHQGTFFVAKYAMGHGILRPECAIEIVTA